MARFIACIAAMYARSDNCANPGVTEQDHAKKSPAISAVVAPARMRIVVCTMNLVPVFVKKIANTVAHYGAFFLIFLAILMVSFFLSISTALADIKDIDSPPRKIPGIFRYVES